MGRILLRSVLGRVRRLLELYVLTLGRAWVKCNRHSHECARVLFSATAVVVLCEGMGLYS